MPSCVFVFVVTSVLWYQSPNLVDAVCQPLSRETVCHDVGYTKTVLPNQLGYENQREVGQLLNEFVPFFQIKCAPDIKLFVCSVYLPMCSESSDRINKAIPPCRSLCQSVRFGCLGLMKHFGYSWPETMNCTKFPVSGPDQLCIPSGNRSSTATVMSSTTSKMEVAPTSSSRASGKATRPKSSSKKKGKKKWRSLKKRQRECQRSEKNGKCCKDGKKMARRGFKKCTMDKIPPFFRRMAKKLSKNCTDDTAKACFKICCKIKRRDLKGKKNSRKRKTKKRLQ